MTDPATLVTTFPYPLRRTERGLVNVTTTNEGLLDTKVTLVKGSLKEYHFITIRSLFK